MANPSADTVRIIPLGGLGEIGRNCTVFETANDAVIVDCGVMFPDAEMLGVDLVIPDFTYIRENADRFRGIVITHGHEDHIGGLPYLLRDVNLPIYGTKLSLGLISSRLKENGLLDKTVLHEVTHGEPIQFGEIEVETFHVCHSIPDGMGVALKTPAGVIVHTGDFKFDHTPVNDLPPDFQTLGKLGREGVLALLCDSTYADRPGYTPSEHGIYASFDNLFAEASGRIIMSTFASLISRIQQIIDVAHDYGRKVAVVGRSMERNVPMAIDLGYLHVPEGILVDKNDIDRYPHEQMVIICTGSQGEPTAALTRISNDDHRQIKLVPEDTVVLSSTPVPGNEEHVNRTINRLFRRGANVIYEKLMPIHVSGHASQEEIKLLYGMIKPKYLIPVHGEYRHLVQQSRLGASVGIPRDHTIIAESGDVIELTADSLEKVDHISAGYVYVDGLGVGDIGDEILRDRRRLADDGVLIVAITVDRRTGELLSEPDLISRGFVDGDGSEKMLNKAAGVLAAEIRSHIVEEPDWTYLHNKVRTTLGRYLFAQTRRRPMILPVVTEV
jgi:ribonuclease J